MIKTSPLLTAGQTVQRKNEAIIILIKQPSRSWGYLNIGQGLDLYPSVNQHHVLEIKIETRLEHTCTSYIPGIQP